MAAWELVASGGRVGAWAGAPVAAWELVASGGRVRAWAVRAAPTLGGTTLPHPVKFVSLRTSRRERLVRRKYCGVPSKARKPKTAVKRFAFFSCGVFPPTFRIPSGAPFIIAKHNSLKP